MIFNRERARRRRHYRIRKNLMGTSERPRLCVFRSLHHIYAQIVDDNIAGKGARTICTASTQSKEFGASAKKSNCKAAKEVGTLIARKAKKLGIQKVVFDRGGFPYHGRVKSLAEGAREGGLEF